MSGTHRDITGGYIYAPLNMGDTYIPGTHRAITGGYIYAPLDMGDTYIPGTHRAITDLFTTIYSSCLSLLDNCSISRFHTRG